MKHYQIRFNQQIDTALTKIKGLSFLFVLSGTLECSINKQHHNLYTGDIVLLNHGDTLLINGCSGYYMQFNVQQQLLENVIDNPTAFDLQPNHNTVPMLKNALAKIGIVYLRKSQYYKLFIEQEIMSLLMLLIKYVPKMQQDVLFSSESDVRLERVCRFIDTHYDQPITLQDMADFVQLSPAYLSKLFTRKMNIGFNQYVNDVRLEHVMQDLIHTDDTMIEIALQNGFTNAALLSRTFKKQTGMSPREYRKQHQQPVTHVMENNISERELIIRLSPFVINDARQFIETPEIGKNIDITFTNNNNNIHQFNHIIQVGDMDALLSEQVQQQLITCKKEIGMTHVLVKDVIESPNLISEEVSTDERISNLQRYNKVDACLDFLIRQNLGLILTIHPIQDDEIYIKHLSDFLKHVSMRMDANDEINIKLYVKYLNLKRYKQIIQRVSSYLPDIKVFIHINIDTPKDTIDIIQSDPHIEQVVFDANQNDIINYETTDDALFEHAKHHIVDKTKKVQNFLQSHQINKSLILLNWNTLTGDTHLTNGEYFRGGIIFEQFLQLNKMIDTIGYWLNYDLHVHHAMNEKEYMNSIELFHQYNGKRPAFFTSHIFKKLLSNVLYHFENCIVVGEPHHFQIIVYDAEHFNPYLTLNTSLPFLDNKEVTVKVNTLLPGTYRVKHYTLDKEHGALYQVWQSYNTQSGIDAESIEYINRVSYPKLRVSDQTVQQDFEYNLKLLTNAIHLIDVKRYIE
ncbi:transcriptional regulator AryK [Macrococcoides caseolyticum]|uniref:transcriptional regulator AryK n=1 Tax=Macrococcoides caseolyticum TaxID=69966 RepID=UPI001F1F0BE9|nr:helix-turn-helix domain-containing protein [Macrococcus caseolyticus]MCE4956636.1 helix-turn-helix domain-containing protein [Macrococcus caseolyticus]